MYHQRILVADDESANLELAVTLLTEIGFPAGNIETAENGSTALQLLTGEHQQFDLVLSDLRMPEMDGLTLVRQMRRHGIMLPFIMMTGTVDDANQAVFANEIKHVLPKPFRLKEFRAMINRAISELEDTPTRVDVELPELSEGNSPAIVGNDPGDEHVS